MLLATLDDSRFAPGPERDRARVYRLVTGGLAHSRSEVGRLLGLRSTTTSRVVGDLLSRRLLLETMGETAGRGRPAAILLANTRRIGASVIHVASQSLSGALVDLSGHVVAERTITIGPDAGNDALAAIITELARQLLASMPEGMSHAGTVVSLSGLLDLANGRWLLASRWPRMRGLGIAALLSPIAGPVEICRNLDAELRARAVREPALFSGGTLLLHWGWGIGLSYAVDGQPFAPRGSFGEIGHWRLSALADRACGCGNSGCLETGAALWSLMPALRALWPDLAEDETRLGRQLAGSDLVGLPEIDMAARLLARALANACRMLFPSRVAISGPFVANAGLWTHFEALFRAEGTMEGLAMPELANVRASPQHEIHGAAAPLLARATEALLRQQG